MKLTLLFFLFTGICLQAQYEPKQVRVRVVTFADAGVDMALTAARPGCDEDLFASLTKSAAAGETQIVYDQVQLVRNGQRANALAAHEFPYVPRYCVDTARGLMIPKSLAWQVAGPELEAEATVGEAGSLRFPGCPLDLSLRAENHTMLKPLAWPAADLRDQGQMNSMSVPLFSRDQLQTQALAATGMTLLLSVTADSQSAAGQSSETRFLYTFLRAGVNGERPKRDDSPFPTPTFQRRLHAVSLRLPAEEAAVLLSRRSDDASLFASLSAKAAAGEAGVSGHAAILGRDGQRYKMESAVQYPFPADYADLIPSEWSFRPLGTMMEVDAGGQFSEKETPIRGDWHVDLDLGGSPELTAFHPDRNRPDLHVSRVEYTSRRFTGNITVPASGILCGGIISSGPATQKSKTEGSMTDVLFFLQSPPPTQSATPAKQHQWVEAVLLSLPANGGPALVAGGDGSGVLGRMGTAGIYCAGCAAVAAEGDHRSEFQWMRHIPHPAGFHKSVTSPGLDIPSSWEGAACGLKLEATFVPKSGPASINATLSWDTAPVQSPGEPGAKVWEMAQRRCEEKVELKSFPLTRGKAIIADVRPSNAREGTPEHGRWHVLVIRTIP